jgi:hypothetical protein
MASTVIRADGFSFTVTRHPDGWTIQSDLRTDTTIESEADRAYHIKVETLETVVLAHLVAGVDVRSPRYLNGLGMIVQQLVRAAA